MSGGRVHESAIVESDSVGDGTQIWAFAHVMAGSSIGKNCKIGDHVFIETGAVVGDRVTVKNNSLIWYGVTLGDDVFVGPNTVFTNDLIPRAHARSGPEDWLETLVDNGATIGANATIVCGLRIGAHAMVGAGAVVTKAVRDHELVSGNPARPMGWVCYCGHRLTDSLECSRCHRSFLEHPDGLVENHRA